MFTQPLTNIFDLVGRILLGVLFLGAGIDKISNYSGTQGWMEAMGVPGVLLPLVIVLEIAAPILLIIGFKARYAALALAGFSIMSAIIFHFDFSDQIQSIMFMKNFAIAGGLLMIAAHGIGKWSIDKQ